MTLETKTFTWDARNRLTDISGPGLTASFDYDALGRRISKIINGTTTTFVYDGWDIIQETTGGVTTDYTRTLNIDEPLALERSDGTTRYYVQDALGSVIALTDANGVVTTTYSYDAFGAVTINGTDEQPFQYTGRENDGTGLYYYRARYYSPEMRRFISEDPIRLWGGINFYAYVGNGPVNHNDPFGLEPPDDNPPDDPPGNNPPNPSPPSNQPPRQDPTDDDNNVDCSHCYEGLRGCLIASSLAAISAAVLCTGACIAVLKNPYVCGLLCASVAYELRTQLDLLCIKGYEQCLANCRR